MGRIQVLTQGECHVRRVVATTSNRRGRERVHSQRSASTLPNLSFALLHAVASAVASVTWAFSFPSHQEANVESHYFIIAPFSPKRRVQPKVS